MHSCREFGLGAHSSVAPHHLRQKVVFHPKPADFGLEPLYVLFVVSGPYLVPAEHLLGPFGQSLLSALNPIGGNVELLRRLGQGALTLEGRQSDLHLEG